MKKKKSRIQLAREIIANLRLGMHRQPATQLMGISPSEATPFTPQPMPIVRYKRSNQLQTSRY